MRTRHLIPALAMIFFALTLSACENRRETCYKAFANAAWWANGETASK